MNFYFYFIIVYSRNVLGLDLSSRLKNNKITPNSVKACEKLKNFEENS